MASKQEQTENLFGKLETQLKNRQTKRALKTTDEILKTAPGDADAVSCKVALLIDLGNTSDALKLIDANPTLSPSLAFERAYCTYRQGRLQEALTALKSLGNDDRPADRLQLEAQVQYRLGNHSEAIALYSRLFQDHKTENLEVQTNIVASYAMGGRSAEVPAVLTAMRISPKDSFELAFNVACGMIESGNLDAAEDQLALARRVGEETLYEEEMEEEEVAAELAPVAAQLAYIAARRGLLEEAVTGLRDAIELDSADTAAGAAAAIDLSAALLRLRPGDRKAAAEGLKGLEPCVERAGGLLKVKSGLESRLGAMHCEALLTGYATAALVANKTDVAREAVRSMETLFKGSVSGSLLQAALLARDGKAKDAAAALQVAAKALTGTPAAVDAALMRVQLAVQSGDAAGAAGLLATLPADQQNKPAVVATRAALLEQQGDVKGAVAVLHGALKNGDAAAARWILRRLAMLEIDAGNLDAAVDHLQRLVDSAPESLEDPELLTLLPRLVAYSKPEAAKDLLAKLPSPPAMTSAAVDGLEASGASASAVQRRGGEGVAAAAGGAAGAAVPGGKRKADGEGTDKKKERKRKRKKRLPKNFDPENPGPMPDPERWMAKWQRADAKKARKKKKDKDQIKGSQGAGKIDSSLDRTGPAAAAPAPAASSGKSSSNKKKGKGRR